MNAKILVTASMMALSLSLAGCGEDEPKTEKHNNPAPPAAAASASAKESRSAAAAAEPSVSASKRADAEDKAGLAPAPDKADAEAFVKALREIDNGIVTGASSEALIERARDQCTVIYNNETNDNSEVIVGANVRFATPDRPDGFGLDKAKKINDAVKKHICPKAWN